LILAISRAWRGCTTPMIRPLAGAVLDWMAGQRLGDSVRPPP
jgi:hypothetical protein